MKRRKIIVVKRFDKLFIGGHGRSRCMELRSGYVAYLREGIEFIPMVGHTQGLDVT